MRHLDLFSGIGGFALAAQWAGFETVAFCEIEPYRQRVLRKNFGQDIIIHDDIKQLDGTKYTGTIDLLTGGFPCQPYSIAGKRKGDKDPRALWREMFRIIREVKPTWIVGENVANFANMALHIAKADLESEGYEVVPFNIPACGVGAPHQRQRIFVVAHTNGANGGSKTRDALHKRRRTREGGRARVSKATRRQNGFADRNTEPTSQDDVSHSSGERRDHRGNTHGEYPVYPKGEHDTKAVEQRRGFRSIAGSISSDDTNAPGAGLEGWELYQTAWSVANRSYNSNWWRIEPSVGRVAHGVPNRVDRISALGDAVVPQQVYPILKGIADIMVAA